MFSFSNRRRFLAESAAGLGAVSAAAQTSAKPASPARLPAPGGKLALLGGAPVRKQKFPSWPNFGASDEKALLDVLHSRLWCRMVAKATSNRFEEAFAKMLGAKHLIAVNSGTMALVASLHVLGVGPGDEVIVPVYTFGATCLFELLSRRYERGSMILTNNKSYGDWGTIFADNVIASAILDRLLHHSTTVNIKGESYRLKDKKKPGVLAKAGQQGG